MQADKILLLYFKRMCLARHVLLFFCVPNKVVPDVQSVSDTMPISVCLSPQYSFAGSCYAMLPIMFSSFIVCALLYSFYPLIAACSIKFGELIN